MADEPLKNNRNSDSLQNPFSKQIRAREVRKVRARQSKDRTLWVGLGAFGAIGWSIVVPTFVGVMVGVWIDRNWPSPFSWTLALLLAGVSLGSMSAWIWVSKERSSIDEEQDKHS